MAASISSKNLRSLGEVFQQRCREQGFDLVHPFNVQCYNAAVSDQLKLPNFNRQAPLGFLIGNTKSVWPAFLSHLRANPQCVKAPHPFDNFTKSTLTNITTSLFPSHQHEIRWGHETGPGRLVAMQKLAHLSGLAYLDTECHLNIHATYGPWIAFRGALVLDAEFVDFSEEAGEMKSSVKEALQPKELTHPCQHLSCLAKKREATKLALAHINTPVREKWSLWVAVRDACDVGREHRYSQDQVLFHYRHDPEHLSRVLEADLDACTEHARQSDIANIDESKAESYIQHSLP